MKQPACDKGFTWCTSEECPIYKYRCQHTSCKRCTYFNGISEYCKKALGFVPVQWNCEYFELAKLAKPASQMEIKMDKKLVSDIDREIAEKIMGWTVFNKNSQSFLVVYDELDELGEWFLNQDGSDAIKVRLWRPTMNFEQAFMVIDKMRENWNFKIEIYKSGLCEVEIWDRNASAYIASADAPAMAICLAALKAVVE